MRSLVFLSITALRSQKTTADNCECREELSLNHLLSGGLLVDSASFVATDDAAPNHARRFAELSGGAQLDPIRPYGGDFEGQQLKFIK